MAYKRSGVRRGSLLPEYLRGGVRPGRVVVSVGDQVKLIIIIATISVLLGIFALLLGFTTFGLSTEEAGIAELVLLFLIPSLLLWWSRRRASKSSSTKRQDGRSRGQRGA